MIYLVEYPHPLDYATGLKYALTRSRVNVFFKPSPDNFRVEEVVNFDKLGFNKERGEFAVLRIVKRSVETFRVLDLLESELGIPSSNIYIFGLKDKDATTVSHAFIRSHLLNESVLPVIKKDVAVELLGYVKRKPTRSHHVGNRFRINVEDVTSQDVDALKEVIKVATSSGLLSYYGYQRFGYRRYNSHVLGKMIIIGREDIFAHYLVRAVYPLEPSDLTLKRIAGDLSTLLYEREYVRAPMHRGVARILEKTRGIYLDAYASYLYNLLINYLVETRGISSLFGVYLPLPGCSNSVEYYRRIAEIEGVNCEMLKQLPCSTRPALFKTYDTKLDYSRGMLVFEFTLEPGMYASVVLREIFKENFLLSDVESYS